MVTLNFRFTEAKRTEPFNKVLELRLWVCRVGLLLQPATGGQEGSQLPVLQTDFALKP